MPPARARPARSLGESVQDEEKPDRGEIERIRVDIGSVRLDLMESTCPPHSYSNLCGTV